MITKTNGLIKNPKILILDEPTSHLDQTAQKIILKILSKIKKDTTILLVCHDLNTIIKHVDKMLLIDKTIKMLSLDEICEHFALGLYHHPLINSKHPHKHD